MKYHFKIHKEGDGFWAECLEIPGCLTQGDSKDDLLDNMSEAVNLCLQESANSEYLAPLPDESIKKSKSVVEVQVDPSVALAFSIRYNRIQSKKSQEEVAKELGMKNVYSYQRLEKKCNPTLAMMEKLTRIYPNLSVDRVLR